MTRQYTPRTNQSRQKEGDNWILQRTAVRSLPAKTLTSQTKTPVQRQEQEKKAENKTGLPDRLKQGIENLSGYDLSGVRVNYNSPKPAQVNALAYTQGQAIEVAPGQERHLPHEAWHAVQQMQGRVRPTMEVNGVGVNDNRSLEREADVMGHGAVQMRSTSKKQPCKDRGTPETTYEQALTTPTGNIFPHLFQARRAKTKRNTDLHESESNSVIQRAQADKPTSVRVEKVKAEYKNPNFVLSVRNMRYINDEKIGAFKKFGDGGQVSEQVEYEGTDLKGQSENSQWQTRGTSIDNHSIPRSRLASGSTRERKYIPGWTTAKQMFIYKDNTLKNPSPIAKSGFEIIYTHRVYDGTKWIKEEEKIAAEPGVSSELTIEKRPAKVNISGVGEALAGDGDPVSQTWEIHQPTEETPLVWQVNEKP